MTQNNPDPLEDFNEEMDMAHQLVQEAKGYEGERGGPITDHLDAAENHMQAAAAIIAQHYAPVIAENERLRAENYKTFTDGMEAAAQICGSLAETTYDDTDAFEAATGCEAEIMKVVKQQRKEQALGAKP